VRAVGVGGQVCRSPAGPRGTPAGPGTNSSARSPADRRQMGGVFRTMKGWAAKPTISKPGTRASARGSVIFTRTGQIAPSERPTAAKAPGSPFHGRSERAALFPAHPGSSRNIPRSGSKFGGGYRAVWQRDWHRGVGLKSILRRILANRMRDLAQRLAAKVASVRNFPERRDLMPATSAAARDRRPDRTGRAGVL
jgi:hypothetical protein